MRPRTGTALAWTIGIALWITALWLMTIHTPGP